MGEGTLREYKCGHAFWEPPTAAPTPQSWNYTSNSGKYEAFAFQKEFLDFAAAANYNVLNADPMGLGKTIQACLCAREAKLSDGSPRFRRVLAVVKSATTYQWFYESKEWLTSDLWSAFVIRGTKNFIPPGFRLYIISMDTLARFANPKAGGLAKLQELGIDLVIVDECHSFKNPESARSQALVQFLQDISQSEITRSATFSCVMCDRSWKEDVTLKINTRSNQNTISMRHSSICVQCGARVVTYQDKIAVDEKERTKGLILLSGTPIKNRAEEYFIPLNLLRPDHFTSLEGFRKRWLDQDPETGKWNRIKSWRLEEFRELTKDFIIRREKNEVLSLPPFRRTFTKVDIQDEKFRAAYNTGLAELQKKVDSLAKEGQEMTFFEMQENLMSLRRIVAAGKMASALDYVEEFLESTENEKILIGIHHDAIRDNMFFSLKQKGISVLKLSGEDTPERKNQLVQKFNTDPQCRVMIVNMLAGGVGLNLQAANNILVLERQWNAADEEQFEGRCDRQGQTLPVLADYMIAEGIPIEDYFTAMVEEKRQICGESLDGWSFTNDKEALRELVHRTLATPLRAA